MRKTHGTKFKQGMMTKILAMALVVMLLVQSLAFSCAATAEGLGAAISAGKLKGDGPSFTINGIGDLTSSQVSDELRQDIINSFNKDLVKKAEYYSMTGPVEVIITFSFDSMLSTFASSAAGRMTYDAFLESKDAKALEREMTARQSVVIDRLFDAGLINEVLADYVHILDGAFVSTTYEDLEAITAVEGVQTVMLSQSYRPQEAVNNPVDVYDTGIFNSGSVKYTGKGTLVAVLDTGCDYSHSAFTTHTVEPTVYNRDYVQSVLSSLRASELTSGLEAREVYYGHITNNKIVYGYDYADKDPDVMPFENSHGTHVAGIIAGKDDNITGVAIDAQLAIMKVFSDYDEGAKEGDILAALEDSVVLGVDAINMSLGSSCGFTYESALDKMIKNQVYQNIEEAGISLVVAASNDYSSGYGSGHGDTNMTDNPDSATVGSPSTYEASMSVASINGNKDNYMLANGDYEVFFTQAMDTAGEEYDFFRMLGIVKGEKVTYDYVTVPGYGMAINYSGINANGKIALVKRGEISFEEKVQYAQEAGAIAVIIYNNVFGSITMTIGNNARIPAVSIGKDDGEMLAASSTGTIEFDLDNVAGPFMSGFSSWGPSPDLSLKPEITAHGGNIESAVVGGDYDKYSGTSMAAPNMCGITLLIRQYVEENFTGSKTELRDLVYELCMSTATIALDKNGNPYSPRKQGAGIADIGKSTTTGAYLYVDKRGKTKLELGDDPQRTGVYTMTLYLENFSSGEVSYRLGNITMTESVSTSDPEYVAEMAYILSPDAQYSVEGGTLSAGVLTVGAGQTAKVTATLTLSAKDKSYINSTFANGMYVEGYLTFDNIDDNGVDLNAPFLAFYGDWGEAPIFDIDYYEVETEAHNNAIDEDDKIKADYYATTPTGTYYYDYVIPLGTYLYSMDESLYNAIPATMDKAAVSYYKDAISGIYAVFTGLLRGAKELNITMVNTTTGEVLLNETKYNCYKAHFTGTNYPYIANIKTPTVDTEKGTMMGANNAKIEVTMSAKLDWSSGENLSDSYTFSFYVDYQAPTITNSQFRTKYDNSLKKNRYYLDLWVYDNHYAMSARPIVVYDSKELDDQGKPKKTYSSLSDSPIPIYQSKIGEVTKVTMEITDYLDLIADSSMPNGVTVYLDDYALNGSVSYIPFPGTDDVNGIEFAVDNGQINMDINQVADLTTLLVAKDTATTLESDYLRTLQWSIESGSEFIRMDGGRVEAIRCGQAIVKVTSDSWYETNVKSNGSVEKIPIYKTLVIDVSNTVIKDNPLSAGLVQIEALNFSHYKTLFAFSSDIDYSKIGSTGSVNYFGNNYSIECYPSEQIQLGYELKPWNLDPSRYQLTWSSSNPTVATVDENGVVTAESKGIARITLNITVDGRTSVLAARLAVEVKSEFVIENRTLVAYKGKGGDVEIPEHEGILYIGSYAFSHYDLDNEKEVPTDENGYYDLDDKKTPLGNKTVTSVKIPEGVQTIQKHAFYGCDLLSSVTLPESCETIGAYAFAKCPLLENVNFDNVKIIADYAFAGCESLTCDDLGGPNLEKLYSVGNYGFGGILASDGTLIAPGARFASLKLPKLSRIGVGAFAYCTKLTEVELGERTRISERMFEGSAITSIVTWSDTVSDHAFTNCKDLEEVVFKSDLTYLGVSAFEGCTALSSVSFEGVVEKIATMAFSSCSSLESLTLPNCAVEIDDAAFSDTGLKTLKFLENTEIENLGMAVFENVGKLTLDLTQSSLYEFDSATNAVYADEGTRLVLVVPGNTVRSFTLPAKVTEICDGAFASLTELRTVTLQGGSALAKIGDCAFAGCTQLSSVELPDGPLAIGDYAFWNTWSLASVDLSGVYNIGKYAFYKSAIYSADLSTDGVVIGEGAFYGTSYLYDLTLGDDATVGDYAFYTSGARAVELKGDASIGQGAFYLCQYLTSFDFSELTGIIPAYAFYGCVSLQEVNAPYVTEIGDFAFSDCCSLNSFTAPLVEKLGSGVLSPTQNTEVEANKITTLTFPALRELGEGAFFINTLLQRIEMPALEVMGNNAFYGCVALESVSFSDKLTAIPDYAFYSCFKLSDVDLSKVVTVGTGAFIGTVMPETLYLPEAVEIGGNSFYLPTSNDPDVVITNNLTEVVAPKLQVIGEQAFAMCSKLTSVTAPVLRVIGDSALAYTGLTELGVGDSLESCGLGVFEGCEDFLAFYVIGEYEDANNVTLDNVMVNDGALYLARKDGWTLVSYPAAKDGDTLTVAEGTVRIDHGAAMNAKSLKTVILPSTLKYIGNMAFYGCDSLETVQFKSYYAPTLEGTMTDMDITINDLDKYPGFDLLYGMDYFYMLNYKVTMPFFYSTFVGAVGSLEAEGLTAVIPENCEGYDNLIYRAYFDFSEQNGGVTMGKFAVAFIDSVYALPESIDRFDSAKVEQAIVAYNALMGHSEELVYVSEELLARYAEAVVAYNVDIAESKIERLYDIYMDEYSFNKVKDARATYLALTDEERALVSNGDVLDAKIAELCLAFGKDIDFSLNYKDYAPVDPPADDGGIDDPVQEPDGMSGWLIALIAVSGAVVLGAAAVFITILIRKKKTEV